MVCCLEACCLAAVAAAAGAAVAALAAALAAVAAAGAAVAAVGGNSGLYTQIVCFGRRSRTYPFAFVLNVLLRNGGANALPLRNFGGRAPRLQMGKRGRRLLHLK